MSKAVNAGKGSSKDALNDKNIDGEGTATSPKSDAKRTGRDGDASSSSGPSIMSKVSGFRKKSSKSSDGDGSGDSVEDQHRDKSGKGVSKSSDENKANGKDDNRDKSGKQGSKGADKKGNKGKKKSGAAPGKASFNPLKTIVAGVGVYAERRREKARVRQRRRAEHGDMPQRRPLFARLYSWVIPGDYTAKQDRYHVIAVSCVVAVLVGLVAFSGWRWSDYLGYQVSDSIIVPETTFTTTQVDTVIGNLEEQGFRDVQYVDGTGVVGYGTPEMVDAYKESYKEKSFDPARDELATAQLQDYGIEEAVLSSDWKELTLYTYTNDDDSALISYMLTTDSEVEDLVNTFATWCKMYYDGEELTIEFIGLEDGQTYLSRKIATVSELISTLESEENEKAQTDAEKSDDANTNASDDGEADDASNGNADTSDADDSGTESSADDADGTPAGNGSSGDDDAADNGADQ